MISLVKALPRIAAQELHNTHCFPQNLKTKYELIAEAYGAARVEDDFREWCIEVREQPPRYPITAYLKFVDQRLGPKFADQKENVVDVKDPRIPHLIAAIYEFTGFGVHAKALANFLADFSEDEILAAVREYSSTLDEKEIKSEMRSFFHEGVGIGIIYAQRKRHDNSGKS